MDNPGKPDKVEIDEFKGLLESLGWTEANLLTQISLRTLAQRWSDIVGPIFANQSEPSAISGETLIVIVSHAAYKQELLFLKYRILSLSKRYLGRDTVRKLEVRVGSLSKNTKKKTGIERTSNGINGKDDLLAIAEKEADPEARKRLLELIEYL
ncbi:PF05258 family protein [Leptospira inadai serovar Lyme str. 10]|uniref:PF05258 family protein n=2 Tax=Leptospira inadai serovar Lyme TaxID=293084 RepID=V6H8H6_9LEPT|nr:DUF721 domain-containing protein [Leptospira inadai]EQA35032.1 PF05258 family protein [Leptospira inadai serovar Lyme str. 10]PNV75304.1 DUF721 domain-containing protein [Leptospira inadai serovar Lyme]